MSLNLDAKKLRADAIKLIKEARENKKHIYTEEEIKRSRYPNRTCQLCGQKGCEIKYAHQYLHKSCYRILKKYTESILK